jgi:hypothetical protein
VLKLEEVTVREADVGGKVSNRRRGSVGVGFLLALALAAAVGCSAGSSDSGNKSTHGASGAGATAGSLLNLGAGSGGGPAFDFGGNTGGPPVGPCEGDGWRCKIPDCTGKSSTTVRATVYDPAGVTPLYDVAVYVPNAEVAAIPSGATCETCATPVSGSPITSALTNYKGEFVLDKDVPAGVGVPLVIQVGKWRRVIKLPEVKACQENVFTDPQLMRLPRNQAEGNLPKIALTTGDADALECFLRRVGISDSEFTNPDGPGRVNLYVETGSASYKAGGSFPPATQLWNSLAAMKANDILLMACSGTDDATRRGITAANKADLKTYLDGGGRVFLEHYHDTWLRGGNESPVLEEEQKYQKTPFPAMATWLPVDDPDYQAGHPGAFAPYTVDVSFPKGKDFADWLQFVGASPKGLGTIDLYDVKHPAMSTLPPSRGWISDATGVPYFSFNTPLEAAPEAQCGRVVHTGIHVGVEKLTDDDHGPFPGACASNPMTAQEKALEFLLFDLSSCVMTTDQPPMPPVVVK